MDVTRVQKIPTAFSALASQRPPMTAPEQSGSGRFHFSPTRQGLDVSFPLRTRPIQAAAKKPQWNTLQLDGRPFRGVSGLRHTRGAAKQPTVHILRENRLRCCEATGALPLLFLLARKMTFNG